MRILTPELSPTSSKAEFDLHMAALEWSLSEPIIINSAQDIRSVSDWKGKVEPYYHQVQNLMRFCRRLPVTLLADDVGLGKTISAGLIISELMKRSKVKKVFVICPSILIPQWVEELNAKFGIGAYGTNGSQIRWARNRSEPVIVTTYQSATGFLEQLEAGLFDMLILDEAHKVRNLHGTKKPPKMATAVYKALEARMFKYVLMLTATPIQNRLWDIYSLIDCLAVARGHRNPLGTPDNFFHRYIEDGRTNARKLRPEVADEFRKIVGTYMFRTRRVDAQLAFPDRKVQNYAVTPTPEEMRLQQIMAKHIGQFTPLAQTSLLVALMSSPQALAAQLRNMASKENASKSLTAEVEELAERIKIPAKIAAILKIVNDLNRQSPHWRMVIFTTRTETQEMIGRVLKEKGISCGFIRGADPVRNRQSIERFRKEIPEINALVSTDAGAEGVNLQASNILVNYDLPWNPMIVEQRIGRVQRIGSKFKNVWVANIVHDKSPEQKIVIRLLEKLQVIAHTVGDIEAVLEASDDSDGESLEKQIREMVVATLQGQDQEFAARAAEDSIENARKLIEENRAEIDNTLGAVTQSEDVDVPMPRLTINRPSTKLHDFVFSALKAEGGEIIEQGSGIYTLRGGKRGDEQFCFSDEVAESEATPGVFHGKVPVVYQTGRPAFERLVQRWLDRAAVYLTKVDSGSSSLETVTKEWVESKVKGRFLRIAEEQKENRTGGKLVCRTRVSNAVDSYEKIAKIPFVPGANGVAKVPVVGIQVNVTDVVPNTPTLIQKELSEDEDIRKFEQYYQQRLERELKKSSGDRKVKLENDLKPSTTVEVVAVEGVIRYDSVARVLFCLDSDHIYESTLKLSKGEIIAEPEFEQCSVTNRSVPSSCLEVCAYSGRKTLRELFVRSSVSGKFLLPELAVTCPATNTLMHPDEGKHCAITGKIYHPEHLKMSLVSGRWALPEYLKKCEITGVLALSDELVSSDISQKLFRKDEAVHIGATTQLAHKSELTQCDYSGLYYFTDEMVVSDVTGKRLHRDRLVRSSVSGRKSDLSEKRVCSVTGAIALADEVGMSSISGKIALLNEIQSCPDTGKTGLVSEMFKSAEGDLYLHPDAVAVCCVSGHKARKKSLAKSEVSGKYCKREYLEQCEASGKLVLESELGTCEKSGCRIDSRLLHRCEVSGKLVSNRYLTKSSFSNKVMMTEFAMKLPNGAIAGKNEVTVCTWTSRFVAIDKALKCRICGLVFGADLINANGEFKLLRQCLDGEIEGEDFPDPQLLARSNSAAFGGISSFRWISSESKKTHIMFGRKSIFGFASKYFAVLATGNMLGFQLVGDAVFGKRTNGKWQKTETHRM